MQEDVRQSGAIAGSGEERRTAGRRRVLKGATLHFNKGFGAAECVVRNLSDAGALLSMGETFAVPPRFDLKLSDEAGWRRAEIRWRAASRLGVEFVDARA